MFILAIALRVLLALVNREANDNHLQVISMIADSGVNPGRDDCWECFQPKFYHAVCALMIRMLGLGPGVPRILLAQFVNVAAGIATLVFLRRFIARLAVPPLPAFWAFALIALNPGLVGIDGQATNDSFVILFSTAALYFTWLVVREYSTRALGWMTLFTVLAAVTKGSGLVVFVVELLVLIMALAGAARRQHLLSIAVLAGVFLATVPFLGPYARYYRLYGSPLVVSIPHDPPPAVFTETYPADAGVTSVAQAYFTFRLFDLIREPVIRTGSVGYPQHRTSLWSQLYGRAHFAQFGQWPPSWASSGPRTLAVGRAILVLALFPLLCGLAGIGRAVRNLLRKAPSDSWVFLVFGAGFFGMIVKYTYDYRCYCTMKAIFVFPALLCAARFFVDGFEPIGRSARRHPVGLLTANGVLSLLLGLYLADSIMLIVQLAV